MTASLGLRRAALTGGVIALLTAVASAVTPARAIEVDPFSSIPDLYEQHPAAKTGGVRVHYAAIEGRFNANPLAPTLDRQAILDTIQQCIRVHTLQGRPFKPFDPNAIPPAIWVLRQEKYEAPGATVSVERSAQVLMQEQDCGVFWQRREALTIGVPGVCGLEFDLVARKGVRTGMPDAACPGDPTRLARMPSPRGISPSAVAAARAVVHPTGLHKTIAGLDCERLDGFGARQAGLPGSCWWRPRQEGEWRADAILLESDYGASGRTTVRSAGSRDVDAALFAPPPGIAILFAQ